MCVRLTWQFHLSPRLSACPSIPTCSSLFENEFMSITPRLKKSVTVFCQTQNSLITLKMKLMSKYEWIHFENESKQKALFFYHVWLNAGSCSMSEKSYSFRNLDQSVEINKANVIHWLITVNLKLRNEIREHLHPRAALGNHTFSSLSQSCLTASWAF